MHLSIAQLQLLDGLEYSREEKITLLGLNKEDFLTALNKKKRQLSLKYHPDKTNNDPQKNAKYLAMTKAYEQLVMQEACQPDVLKDIKPFDFEIPIDCLDFNTEEQIDDHFEQVSRDYMMLPSSEERDSFIQQNHSFLQFILWLNQNRTKIHHVRNEQFYQMYNQPSLLNTLYQDWNRLLIQLFGEENLDDMTYREAIALGELWSILAIRKLLSPLKWLCLIISAPYNLLTGAVSHLIGRLWASIIKDIEQVLSNPVLILALIVKSLILLSIYTIPLFLIPNLPRMLLLSLPLLSRVLFYLANPINSIIRPLAGYFNQPSLGIGAVAIGVGILAASTLGILISYTSLMMALEILITALSFLALISQIMLLERIYRLSPLTAIMVAALSIAILFMPSDTVVNETIFEYLVLSLALFSSISLNAIIYRQLSNIIENAKDRYSELPLPEQPAPQMVKETVRGASTNNHWSHSFFNTPVKKPVQSPTEPAEKHSSLFGGKEKNKESYAESVTIQMVAN